METIFEKSTRDELIRRIASLNIYSKAVWGKMNVYQMTRHNTRWNEWMLGKNNSVYRQAFVGKLFGKMALKKLLGEGRPLDKNTPTADLFRVKEADGDLAVEKAKWISLINDYENYHNPGFIHMFFGKMTKEQIGILAYKHTDHHLRQFGC